MRTTLWSMIALGLVSVVLAVIVPGSQLAMIVLGAALVSWATFGLLTQ